MFRGLRGFLLPLLALAGVAFAGWRASEATKKQPATPPVIAPAQAAFPVSISGAGIIEPSTEDIKMGTLTAGVVANVAVKIGDTIKVGSPLFSIDDRDRRAMIDVKRSQLEVKKAQLERLREWPRKEEIPPLEARVRETEATYDDAVNQFRMVESIKDKRAVSTEEVDRRRQTMLAAEARLLQARAQLDIMKAGSWKADLIVAEAEVAQAEASLKADEVELDRLTVKSPIEGEVLRVNIRAGEYAQAGALATPLMIIGGVNRLHVRVDIDENDAWRFNPQAKAIAYVRGNKDLKTELRFERVEPYVVPKRSLTGDSSERVDTRVLQAVYSFERTALPVFVGQQMDVYIEAPALGDGPTTMSYRPGSAK